MTVRWLVTVLTLVALGILAPAALAGQRPAWTPPRTPDGKPDIQGIFTFSTITPLQRPDALAGKDTARPTPNHEGRCVGRAVSRRTLSPS